METTGRKCTKCNTWKPWDDFFRDNTRRVGTQQHMSTCKLCNTASQYSKREAFRKLYGKAWRASLLKTVRPIEGFPCSICNTPMTYGRGNATMCFDHDPITHTFRGWLCQSCNVGLGNLGDSIQGLTKALHYLQHAQTNQEHKHSSN